MSIFRLTGKAEAVTERRGTTKGEDPRPYVIREQPIRANEFVVTTIQLDDTEPGFEVGSDVDAIVDVSARGSFLQVRLRGVWPTTGGARSSHAA